jgi:hypothetical protein
MARKDPRMIQASKAEFGGLLKGPEKPILPRQ